MGSSLAYDNGIWGEPYRLFVAKFLFVGVFLVCAKGGLRHHEVCFYIWLLGSGSWVELLHLLIQMPHPLTHHAAVVR